MSAAKIMPKVVWVAALGGFVTLLSPTLVGHLQKWESGPQRALIVYADKLAGGLPTVCNGLTRHVTLVNLAVFDANGNQHSRTSVALVQDGGAVPSHGYYCEWMPYQKGQAAKHDAAAKAATSAEAGHFNQRDQLEQALVSGVAIELVKDPSKAKSIAEGIKSFLDALHPKHQHSNTRNQQAPSMLAAAIKASGLDVAEPAGKWPKGVPYQSGGQYAEQLAAGALSDINASASAQADQAAEAEIVAAGLTAPRVTADQSAALQAGDLPVSAATA